MRTSCLTCGRVFAKEKKATSNPKAFCVRATKYGAYCNDPRCKKIRNIMASQKKPAAGFASVPSHCTENMIKFIEKR